MHSSSSPARIHRALARGGALLALTAAVAIPASAAAGTGVTMHVSPASVHRGHLVHVYGRAPGCNGAVTLISGAFTHKHDFAGQPAVTAKLDSHANYSVNTRIPSTRKPKSYSISGRCGGANIGVSATLHVLK